MLLRCSSHIAFDTAQSGASAKSAGARFRQLTQIPSEVTLEYRQGRLAHARQPKESHQMNGHRTIVGLCILCALLTSALAAPSASAITGTTAFTCSEAAETKDRVGEHCLNIEGTKKFGHIPITANTTTELTTTNDKTANNTTTARIGKLRVTIAGVPLELQVTGASASGWMTNAVNPTTKEHYSHGEGTTTFTGVTVTEPAGRGCKVFTDKEETGPPSEGEVGVVHTRVLKATTEGQGDNLKLEPADGPTKSFMNFFITCESKIEAIEGTWSCTGSLKGQLNGATIEYTHATVTTENQLKCRGAKAGVDFGTTGKGRANSLETYKPLSTTTVTT
ncbi:MAG TPA: hypothetical protein VF081_08880 [Solirubrobacterales bacterium]